MFKWFGKLILPVALAVALFSCTLSPLPPITLIPQRGSYDCGVAALAMYTNRSYEAVEEAEHLLKLDPNVTGGLTGVQMVNIAKQLGVGLEVKQPSQFSLITETGIVVVELSSGDVHAVIISRGEVYDPMTLASTALALNYNHYSHVLYVLVRK